MSDRPGAPVASVGVASGRVDAGRPSIATLIRAHPEISTGIALLVIAIVLVLAAGTRPGFDPYGWLVWGHQTISGGLDTNAAPSWKPLPYLFTVPYALFGHYELWLWMVTSVAISLSGVVFAGQIAYRLTGVWPERRYAPIIAAVVAGLGVLGIRDYMHFVLSYQSDPMIVALCLGAIDCHLSGRRRAALVLAALASLGRPEVWPFAGLYALWLARDEPSTRALVAGVVVAVLALWFGIPALTAKSFFIAGSNALGSGRALHSNKVFGTIDRFLDLHEIAIQLLALIGVAYALLRRERVTLVLAATAVLWVIVEVAFALHGWPGLPRYLFEPAAVMVVLGGVGVGRLLAEPPRLPGAEGAVTAGLRNASTWLGVALVVVAVAGLVPAAISRLRTERTDLRQQRLRTDQINRLASTISLAGGAARVRSCGGSLTRLEYQTILAWQLHVNVARIGFKVGKAVKSGRPIVVLTPRRKGWTLVALHQRRRACRGLHASTT